MEFICDPDTNVDQILDPAIIREMKFQAKMINPEQGAGIHEFHFRLSDGTKIIKTIADL